MKVTALSTGTVRIKTAMARAHGPLGLRLARTLADREFTVSMPIHAWLIDHPDGPILIDTGELAETRDTPFARFEVSPEQEIDKLLEGEGLQSEDLQAVVLTHLHTDHMNGLAKLHGARMMASAAALRGRGRALRRLGAKASAFEFSGLAHGAFDDHACLSADGSVIAVPTPGHAPGHVSVIVREDGRELLIAGDAVYSEAQLIEEHLDGVSLSGRSAHDSMRRIREHSRGTPTVLLPSHDPGSSARLQERVALAL